MERTNFQINLYYGPPGCGKTTQLRKDLDEYIRRMYKGKEPAGIIVGFDPHDEYTEYLDVSLKLTEFDYIRWKDYPSGTIFVFSDCHVLLPSSISKKHQLVTLLNYGRHRGYTIFADSQRPANISKNLSGYATEVKIWKIHSPNDVSYLGKEFGVSKDELEKLKKYHYWVWKRE